MPGRPQPRYPSRRTLVPQPAPRGIYASTFDPELGAAICRRLAAGESLRSICREDPAMPTEKTVWNWARARPWFAQMKRRALETARARSLAAQAARDEAARLARWGPLGEFGEAFGGPCGRTGRPSGYVPKVVEAILDRLAVGEGLTAICRDPDMPCVATVYGWMRRYPEFLARYRAVKAGVAEAMVEIAFEALEYVEDERRWGPMFRRTIRAAEKAAARTSLKRLAPPRG